MLKRIVSWNVNGIRAAAGKGLLEFIETYEPTILCLQETKAHIDQVELDLQKLGYQNSFWSSAQRKGYSGVATFCDETPRQVSRSFGHEIYEQEGRIVVTEHEHFTLFNMYFPNGGSGPERHDFKQRYLKDLLAHLRELVKQDKKIVVVGDYNVAHQEWDVYDPVRLSKESGFLPEERQWMSEFLGAGFVDTFRAVHPEARHRYSWWSYRELARSRNHGWRIDCICISNNLLPHLKTADILDQVQGSDHCPVVCELEF